MAGCKWYSCEKGIGCLEKNQTCKSDKTEGSCNFHMYEDFWYGAVSPSSAALALCWIMPDNILEMEWREAYSFCSNTSLHVEFTPITTPVINPMWVACLRCYRSSVGGSCMIVLQNSHSWCKDRLIHSGSEASSWFSPCLNFFSPTYGCCSSLHHQRAFISIL